MRRGERRTADFPVRPPRGGTGGEPTMPSGNPWLAIGTVDESGGVTPSTGSFGVKDARSLVDGSEVDCDEDVGPGCHASGVRWSTGNPCRCPSFFRADAVCPGVATR